MTARQLVELSLISSFFLSHDKVVLCTCIMHEHTCAFCRGSLVHWNCDHTCILAVVTWKLLAVTFPVQKCSTSPTATSTDLPLSFSCVLFIPPAVWTEVISRTLHGSERVLIFVDCSPKRLPGSLKVYRPACWKLSLWPVFRKEAPASGLTCPRSSLSSINLSTLRYRADQKQNNGREKEERWKTETV